MAIIAPTTTIYFCAGVPLDNRYLNTLFFESRGLQNVYFQGKIQMQMSGCTYQRQTSAIRASLPIESLMNCNYLFFENPEFEKRRFYAFITNVLYINNDCTEVQFEIDLMQTYFLDCTMRQCFIERAHASKDEIGDNLVPENLETGEYIIRDEKHTLAIEPLVICVAATVDENGEPVSGASYSLVYSGVKINVFDSPDEVNAFLTKLTEANQADAVVNIFMMPHTLSVGANQYPKTNEFHVEKPYSDINGYVPKNKKLFIYPYNVMYCTNGEGQAANYRYEDFSESICTILVIGSMCTTPQCILFPQNYKGSPRNFDEKLTLDGWAQCAWNIDSYKAWLAQNANVIDWQNTSGEMQLRNAGFYAGRATDKTMLSVLSGLAGVIAGGAQSAYYKMPQQNWTTSVGQVGGLAGSVYDALNRPVQNTIDIQSVQNQIDGIMAVRQDHSTKPPQANGGGASTVMQGLGLKTFWMYRKQIKRQFAERIDRYFTMYGYAQNRLATPNPYARGRFTYLKTVGCNLQGNAPVWAISGLNKIMDNGITFWKDYVGVGNYTADNSPLGNGEY